MQKSLVHRSCYIILFILTILSIVSIINLLHHESSTTYIDHHDDQITSQSVKRSSKWTTIRTNYLRAHPVCEACGSTIDLNIHHVIPFHIDPSKELDPTNLITLCRQHHLSIGHMCSTNKPNWSCANPNVRKDAAAWLKKHKKADFTAK
jgi:5-methylcytosine-specific restriction endonuclease McrA